SRVPPRPSQIGRHFDGRVNRQRVPRIIGAHLEPDGLAVPPEGNLDRRPSPVNPLKTHRTFVSHAAAGTAEYQVSSGRYGNAPTGRPHENPAGIGSRLHFKGILESSLLHGIRHIHAWIHASKADSRELRNLGNPAGGISTPVIVPPGFESRAFDHLRMRVAA